MEPIFRLIMYFLFNFFQNLKWIPPKNAIGRFDLINVIDDSQGKARDCGHNGKDSQDIVIKHLIKKLNSNGLG